MLTPVLCVVSPFRLRGGLVEWRGGRVVVLSPCLVLSLSSSRCSLSSNWIRHPALSSPFLHCIPSCRAVRFFFVFAVLCVESGKACGVVWCLLFHCQLFMCCGVCFSVVRVLSCLVLLCCVVGCGMAVGEGVCGLVACLSLFSVFFFSFLLLVFGVVRAQPREHARYPRTPLCSPCCVLSSLRFPAPRFSSCPAFPVNVEWRWVIHHVSVCCVGMTATGSLSLSSSFFW